jgi:hypothetical protein
MSLNLFNEKNILTNPYNTPKNKPITLQNNIHNQKHKYREYKNNSVLNAISIDVQEECLTDKPVLNIRRKLF